MGGGSSQKQSVHISIATCKKSPPNLGTLPLTARNQASCIVLVQALRCGQICGQEQAWPGLRDLFLKRLTQVAKDQRPFKAPSVPWQLAPV